MQTPRQETRPADLLIVGGGPTGLYASYYAGFRGLSATILDSLTELGGQVAAMYPEKFIYDVAGFPRVTGRELVTRLRAAGLRLHPLVHLAERHLVHGDALPPLGVHRA